MVAPVAIAEVFSEEDLSGNKIILVSANILTKK